MKNFYKIMFSGLVALSLIGCEKQSSNISQSDANAFTVLAGSETKDMAPLLQKAQEALGFKIAVKYTGTIDGIQQIKDGAAFDAGWFSQSKYFYDTEDGAKRIKLSEKTMLSPIAVGVRQASFAKLAVKDKNQISWKDISDWVTKQNMTYAMTDPSQSNTGYVGLMGVAYSVAGKGENLKAEDVNKEKMKDFFAGHTVNSGSSDWLVDAFKASKVDFMINYESVLMKYNKENANDQLVIVYPFEGIVTSDYPMLLLNAEKTEQYKKLTDFLKSPESQKWITENVYRRSVNAKVMETQTVFAPQMLIEMPFSPDVNLSEQLLSAYYKDFKKPAALVFVLDTSGSMRGEREQQMKSAIESLTVNVQAGSRFAKLREREQVWILPFAEQSYGLKKFELGQSEASAQQARSQVNAYVQALRMDNSTALFSTSLEAVQLLKAEMLKDSKYRYSVIVFTDGESNRGIGSSEFVSQVKELQTGEPIRVFPILFGDGNKSQLEDIAKATGGRVFDGKSKSLAGVFKEIRSYQ